jgi:hypothetical protein
MDFIQITNIIGIFIICKSEVKFQCFQQFCHFFSVTEIDPLIHFGDKRNRGKEREDDTSFISLHSFILL